MWIVAAGVALIFLLPHLRRPDIVLFLGGAVLFWGSAQSVIDGRLDSDYEGDSILTDVRIADFPRVTGLSTGFIAVPVDDG